MTLKAKAAGEKVPETSGRAAEDAASRAAGLLASLSKNRVSLMAEFDVKLLSTFADLVLTHLPEPSIFRSLKELTDRLGNPETTARLLDKMADEIPGLLKKDTVFAEFLRRKSDKVKAENSKKEGDTSRRCVRASVLAVMGDSALDRDRLMDAFTEDNMGEHLRFQETLRNQGAKKKRRNVSEAPRQTVALPAAEIFQEPKFKTRTAPRRSLAPKGIPAPKIQPKKRPIDGEGILNLQKVTREEAERFFGSPANRRSSRRELEHLDDSERRSAGSLNRFEVSCDRIDLRNLLGTDKPDANQSFSSKN